MSHVPESGKRTQDGSGSLPRSLLTPGLGTELSSAQKLFCLICLRRAGLGLSHLVSQSLIRIKGDFF